MVELIKILSKWSGRNDIMKKKQNKQSNLYTFYIFLWPICINSFKHRTNHAVKIEQCKVRLKLLSNSLRTVDVIVLPVVIAESCTKDASRYFAFYHYSLYTVHNGHWVRIEEIIFCSNIKVCMQCILVNNSKRVWFTGINWVIRLLVVFDFFSVIQYSWSLVLIPYFWWRSDTHHICHYTHAHIMIHIILKIHLSSTIIKMM